MLDWLKSAFKSSRAPLKGAAENKYYIEQYKDFDTVLATMYQAKGANGMLVDIDGIVTPLKIDNRQMCSVTDDQGTTPMCAAYSICNICEALMWKKTGKLVNLNAQQVYALAKKLDGDINTDGTYLECAIRAAMQLGGFGKQSKDIKFNFLYNNTKDNKIVEQVKRLIHRYNFLHAGFMIDDAWYNASNENFTIKKGKTCLGGHAVVVCGHDPSGVYIQNSWGKSWGSNGFAVLPWSLVKEQLIYCCCIENFIA